MSGLDHQHRLRAIDPTLSYCVSAPAGSGKTELLTQRLLVLLTRVDRPEQVLAITFTRKAASEMASRVLEKLDEARRSVPLRFPHEATTRKLAQSLLAHAETLDWQLDESTLNIRTIDSLCHEITRQMPIMSGIGGISEPIDDATPLYERAVAQLLAQAGDQSNVGDALRLLLHQFDNRWIRVRELLVSLLARRGDWASHIGQHHDPDGAETILFESVSNLIRQRLSACKARLGAALDPLVDILCEVRATQSLAPLVLSSEADALEDWRAVTDALLTGNGDWRKPAGISIRQGFEKGSEEKQRFIEILTDLSADEQLLDLLNEVRFLPSTQRDTRSWQLLVTISSLLPVLQAHLLLVFQTAGVVDHTHISLAACDALGSDDNPSPIAERLDYQIEHILVDEFQDTAHSQAELLRRLTRDWPDHNVTGKPPRTLFVVGDAMQSIYGFRYADVALFMRIQKSGLNGLNLIPLTLTQNFRSQAGIVNWVNARFASLMGGEEDLNRGRVRHVTASPSRTDGLETENKAVHIDLFSETSSSLESTFIASQIEAVRSANPEASIAVLVRAKSHATEIVNTLAAHGISFEGDTLESQAEKMISRDLLSLCKWLENPADNIAALSLMRSPWVGLSMQSISQLLEDEPGRPFNLLDISNSDRAASLPEDERDRLAALSLALEWAASKRDRLSLPIWIEQIWLRLNGPTTVQPDELTSVRLFLDAARRAESHEGLCADRIATELRHISADSSATPESVRVLTLHKAKGLEFDYVFLPALHKQPRANRRELLRWHWQEGPTKAELLIAADDQEKKAPTLYNYLNWLEKEKQREELKRLLYVGVTRAREKVYLSGALKFESGAGEVTAPAGSLLSLLGADLEHAVRHIDEPEAPMTDSVRQDLKHRPSLYRVASRVLSSAVRGSRDRSSEVLIQSISTDGLAEDNRYERILGVITHRILERLSARNPLPTNITAEIETWIQANCLGANLNKEERATAVIACRDLIIKTLQCPKGRWLLGPHPEAHSEFRIAFVEGSEVREYIIDRTFLDEQENLRWVIDYKTSCPHPQEDEEEFKARELMKYGPQLDNYAQALQRYQWKSDAPIRTALYFPAIQALAY